MTYSNNWKCAHGTSIVITPDGESPVTLTDCTIIGRPGDSVSLIEKTTLGSTRKEYCASTRKDSPTFQVRCSWDGAANLAGKENCKVDITLPSPLAAISINAHILSDMPQPAESGGLLERVLTIKPMGEALT